MILPSNRGLDYRVDFHSSEVLDSGVILKAEEMSLFSFIKRQTYISTLVSRKESHVYSHSACVLVQFSLG